MLSHTKQTVFHPKGYPCLLLKFSTSSEKNSPNGCFSFGFSIPDAIPAMRLWSHCGHCIVRLSAQEIARSVIGLMPAVCCDYALLRHLITEAVPSQKSFRLRLVLLAYASWTSAVDAVNTAHPRKASPERIEMHGMSLIPMDMDVSVLEDTASRKDGCVPSSIAR